MRRTPFRRWQLLALVACLLATLVVIVWTDQTSWTSSKRPATRQRQQDGILTSQDQDTRTDIFGHRLERRPNSDLARLELRWRQGENQSSQKRRTGTLTQDGGDPSEQARRPNNELTNREKPTETFPHDKRDIASHELERRHDDELTSREKPTETFPHDKRDIASHELERRNNDEFTSREKPTETFPHDKRDIASHELKKRHSDELTSRETQTEDFPQDGRNLATHELKRRQNSELASQERLTETFQQPRGDLTSDELKKRQNDDLASRERQAETLLQDEGDPASHEQLLERRQNRELASREKWTETFQQARRDPTSDELKRRQNNQLARREGQQDMGGLANDELERRQNSQLASRDGRTETLQQDAVTLASQELAQERRRESIRQFCGPGADPPSYNISRKLYRYFAYVPRHRLVCCSIQKVGSSFWLRVLQLLTGQVSEFFGESFAHVAGFSGKGSFTDPSKSREELLGILRDYDHKFLFVRDPYSRLFSAYMDKIFLPTNRMFDVARISLGLPKDRERRAKDDCMLNVTFQTFVELVTSGRYQDPHWSSMQSHCDPCAVGFDFVGKMETFTQDAEFILGRAGIDLQEIFPDHSRFESDNERQTLLDWARPRYRQAARRNCDVDSYLCPALRKIWVALQARGLVSTRAPCPFSVIQPCVPPNETVFLQRLTDVYTEHSAKREERMRQRKEAMTEAYLRLPRALLKRVEAYVHDDCAMFNYQGDAGKRFPLPQGGLNALNYSFFGTYA